MKTQYSNKLMECLQVESIQYAKIAGVWYQRNEKGLYEIPQKLNSGGIKALNKALDKMLAEKKKGCK